MKEKLKELLTTINRKCPINLGEFIKVFSIIAVSLVVLSTVASMMETSQEDLVSRSHSETLMITEILSEEPKYDLSGTIYYTVTAHDEAGMTNEYRIVRVCELDTVGDFERFVPYSAMVCNDEGNLPVIWALEPAEQMTNIA